MMLSPFTPLFFPSSKADGIESEYVQTFSTDDEILVEIFGMPTESLNFELYKEPAHTEVSLSVFSTLSIDSSTSLYYSKLKLPAGFYSASFEGRRSTMFRVTSDTSVLEDTVLIQYSPADNRTRADVVAYIGTERQFFAFRIPGGFEDKGWSFSVDNEQFTTEQADIIELYARESIQKILKIGDSAGVPIWFGQMINRILTCKYVYLDGLRYARYQSSVPESEQVADGVNSFIFSQKVQQINNINPQISSLS